jgi:cell division protein FtsN
MKIHIILVPACLFLCISCSVMHKTRKISSSEIDVPQKAQVAAVPEKSVEEPIVEIKEKLVEVKNVPVDPHQYFVIIGSFKNLSNANTHQKIVASDGFTSVLLQNESGLYRVSVKSTDDISIARNEIRRIRTEFKKYNDTWLLISVK